MPLPSPLLPIYPPGTRHGDWLDAFQVYPDGSTQIVPAPGGSRTLGVCYGIDNTGIGTYWYCPQNFGVAPQTSNVQKLGDKATVLR